MAARPKWWHILQGSRHEALLAVDLYNRAALERSLEGFILHMHIAWLYVLHARFLRDDVDYRYRKDNRQFVRVDGEIKSWDLGRCLGEAFPDANNPVRCNVEFFIKIRNKIEHRYEAALAPVLAGKTQALVFNYEETLTEWFGPSGALGESLRFPVFLSNLTPGAVEALKAVHRGLPKRLTSFIREHDDSLPSVVAEDWRYDFRVFLLPQTGPKTENDVVMRFLREDEMTPEQREARDVVQTIVRNKSISVQNKGRHKPSQVAAMVATRLALKFTISHHVAAWRHFQVRPKQGAQRPELTEDRFCLWDEPHKDYLYTDAWVSKLVRELADPLIFEGVTGRVPKPMPGGEPDKGE